MPTKAIHGITVAHFFETYRDKLGLELVTGETGLHRLIKEGSINRPALALTGFFKFFANKRIQVLGSAEMTYLKTLTHQQQIEIFTEMVERQVLQMLGVARHDMHHDPRYYRIRNHLVDFLVSRSKDPKPDGETHPPVVRPGEDGPSATSPI